MATPGDREAMTSTPAPPPEIKNSLERLTARWRLAGGRCVTAELRFCGPLFGRTEETRILGWSGDADTTPEHALEMAAALTEAAEWLAAVEAPTAAGFAGEGA